MKKVIIYPGRFQPMLPHHAEVFRTLQSLNPDADVYIATANKVEPGKSPFDAQEKLSIMTQQHDIPQDRIIIPAGNNLYNKDSYASTFTPAEQHSLFFAVGQKDMEANARRFEFKPLKDGSLSYLQNGEELINTNNAQSMLKHGYVITAPNVPGRGGDVASASTFRSALLSAPDLDSAKETYTRYMGEFNQEIFDLVYDKITGKIMKESLETLKKLAGLLDEAPVNFAPGKGTMDYEPGVSRKDQKSSAERPEKAAASNPDSVGFTKIAPEDMISVDTGKPINSRQRARSMANQFPDGADVNDPAIKKEMFLKLLAQSPGYVLGEINARIENNDDGFAVSDRLSAIVDNLPAGGIMALDDEDRKWTISLVNNAINNMELHRKDAELDNFDDLEAEPEVDAPQDEPEMVSLDDPEFDAPEDELEPEMEEMRKLAGLPENTKDPEPEGDDCGYCELGYADDGSKCKKCEGTGKDDGYFGGTKEYEDDMDEDLKNCGCGERVCKTTGFVDETIEEKGPERDMSNIYRGDAITCKKCEGKPPYCNACDYKGVVLKPDAPKPDAPKTEELNDMRQMAGLERQEEGRMSDIHQDANDMSKEEFANEYPQFADDWEDMQDREDPNEPGQDEIDAVYKKYINNNQDESLDLSAVVESIIVAKESRSNASITDMSDEDLYDYVGQKEEDLIDDIQQHIAPQHLVKDNYEEMFEKYREEVLEPAAEEVSSGHSEGPQETEENLDEFRADADDSDNYREPDGVYSLMDARGREVTAGKEIPELERPNRLVTVLAPVGGKPAHILVKSSKYGQVEVDQNTLQKIGYQIKQRPQKQQGELALGDPGPHQPDLPGMNRAQAQPLAQPKELEKTESIDTAIDNALEETMLELKQLAGL